MRAKIRTQLNVTTLTRIASQENDFDREAGLQKQDYKLGNDNAEPAEIKILDKTIARRHSVQPVTLKNVNGTKKAGQQS